ncbi:MAG: bifunctional nicotinamidase/pyrazinamidase [Planctomycetota bacterium]|jgi:nicotinamidase/pyrazinamidase
MRALVLVDIQNDLLPGGALPVPRGDEVVPVANRVQEHFDVVVATQDWHPDDHGSFAANHDAKKPGDVVMLHGVRQILWPHHCVQETRGADLVTDLDTERVDRVFRKGTDHRVDSYSGFFDNDHKRSTGLGEYLKGRGVTEVYILGLATDYCVKFTAFDSVDQGFSTYVIEDGCRGVELNEGDSDRAIDEMCEKGVMILESGDLSL